MQRLRQSLEMNASIRESLALQANSSVSTVVIVQFLYTSTCNRNSGNGVVIDLICDFFLHFGRKIAIVPLG